MIGFVLLPISPAELGKTKNTFFTTSNNLQNSFGTEIDFGTKTTVLVMSSCHHAVKDFSMVHNDKSKALVGKEDGCPVGYPKKKQSIPVCLGSKEGRG